MGFEIVNESKNADLTVLFDSEKDITIADKLIHAPTGKDEQEIKAIYDHIFNLVAEQSIESLEISIMEKSEVSPFYIYPWVIELVDNHLKSYELNIYLNLGILSTYYKNNHHVEKVLFKDIQKIVDDNTPQPINYGYGPASGNYQNNTHYDYQPVCPAISLDYGDFYLENSLDEMLKKSKPVSFGQRLIQLIDQKGYAKDSIVYNKALVDRRVYHNIISKEDYLPKKNTVILFALALELNEEEAKDFLGYAGYSFSNSGKDQVLLYCIRNRYFNIVMINAYLFDKGFDPILTID